MRNGLPYQLFADVVLTLHVALVMFVVGGFALVIIGNCRHWRWVNAAGFRLAHLAAVVMIVAEVWVEVSCPLTTLEMWLRAQAGAPTYDGSFVGHWLQRVLYYNAPSWVFALVYSLFGVLVLATWLHFPPKSKKLRRRKRHLADHALERQKPGRIK